jgi:glycosyltransferase
MLFKQQLSTAYLPEVLVRMRTGGISNANWTNRLKANREDRMAWKLNGLKPRPWTLLMKPIRKLAQWWKKK